MKYNTQRNQLIMPEYGRGVQNMVEYCLSLPSKEERQQCAETIIDVMAHLQSSQAGQTDFKHKLWNHLARMAHYELDVYYPVDIIPEEETTAHPASMHYPMKKIHHRHYGHLLEASLEHVAEMPEGEERDAYLAAIASQMRQNLYIWNPGSMDEGQVASDVARYTQGKIRLDLETFHFAPLIDPNQMKNLPTTSKKKKK